MLWCLVSVYAFQINVKYLVYSESWLIGGPVIFFDDICRLMEFLGEKQRVSINAGTKKGCHPTPIPSPFIQLKYFWRYIFVVVTVYSRVDRSGWIKCSKLQVQSFYYQTISNTLKVLKCSTACVIISTKQQRLS